MSRNPAPVVVACAMEEEAAPILEFLDRRDEDDLPSLPALPPGFRGPLRFVAGAYEDIPVLVAVTGIGMTNAALAATIIAREVHPQAILFAGTTGGLGEQVRLGDIVLATSALYHDADASAFGYIPGQIPRMPETYEADTLLLATVQEALTKANLFFREGQVSASNSFVSGDQVGPVRTLFPHVLAVDMETAAGAQVCWSFRVPWVSLRAVSDLCDPNAGEVFETSAPSAYEQSAAAVKAVLTAVH